MTNPGVERVASKLLSFGYKALSIPFEIAGVPFRFAAAFTGPEWTLDLVVLADTMTERFSDLAREVGSLARALDVATSRRTLTVIVVGPRPTATTINDLSSNCRVLPVGNVTSDDDDGIRDWLSMFSPLDVPPPSQATGDPLELLAASRPGTVDANDLEHFIVQARRAKASVEAAAVAAISEALKHETAGKTQ